MNIRKSKAQLQRKEVLKHKLRAKDQKSFSEAADPTATALYVGPNWAIHEDNEGHLVAHNTTTGERIVLGGDGTDGRTSD